jgi:pimeloyl-ACP methyl ester carboxylesterase
MWDEQVVALRDVATVVRCDLRGFGRSSEPSAGIPYTHSADLLALLDRLGIDSAVLVGLSMGGRVVLESGVRGLNRRRTRPTSIGRLLRSVTMTTSRRS